jgi:hypothetical protein
MLALKTSITPYRASKIFGGSHRGFVLLGTTLLCDFTFRHVHPAYLCKGSNRDTSTCKDDASSLEFTCQAVVPRLALSYTESTPPAGTLPAPHSPFMFDHDQCYKIGAAHPWTHYIGLYPHLQSMKFDDPTAVKSKDLLAIQGLTVQFKQLWGSYNYKEPVKRSTVASIDLISGIQPRSSA